MIWGFAACAAAFVDVFPTGWLVAPRFALIEGGAADKAFCLFFSFRLRHVCWLLIATSKSSHTRKHTLSHTRKFDETQELINIISSKESAAERNY